jgi:hypothetical protein
MAKKVSFEPAHFRYSAREFLSNKKVIIDEKTYGVEIFDARAAAKYLYHHGISRLTGLSQLPFCNDELSLANSILEYFFNSEREYLLDEQGNTHQMNRVRRFFTPGEVEKYVVLPREDQVRDVLGLGYRSIKRNKGPRILGRDPLKMEEICELYKDCAKWKFKIATRVMPGESENTITAESCGDLTLKLSSDGFRFSID